jgi:hypothetical protein
MESSQDDRPLSIESYFTEKATATLLLERTRSALASGEAIELPDAFVPEFAERLHAVIDATDAWMPAENFRNEGFAFRYHSLRDPQSYPEVRACHAVFDSAPTKRFIADVTGRPCSGRAEFGITRYLPGDYALPHTDYSGVENAGRQIAFLWYLTRDWNPKWGGELYLRQRGCSLSPRFNTFVIFHTTLQSYHLVTPVSPYATGKRMTVTGWWRNPPQDGA